MAGCFQGRQWFPQSRDGSNLQNLISNGIVWCESAHTVNGSVIDKNGRCGMGDTIEAALFDYMVKRSRLYFNFNFSTVYVGQVRRSSPGQYQGLRHN